MMNRWRSPLAAVALFAGAFAAVAPGYVRRYQLSLSAAAGIYLCFLLTVILIVLPAVRALQTWRPQFWFLPLLWCLPYLAYTAGTLDFHWAAFARLMIVGAVPVVLYGLIPVVNPRRFTWQDLIVAVWLITIVLSGQLKGIWTVPGNLDFMTRLFLISIAAWTWTFVRPVPELGFDFSLSAKTFRAAGLNFSLFAAIAIPSGLVIHFIQWNPAWHGFAAFCVDYLGIFLFIALLEEMFFRGFLQALISENFASVYKGQFVASCLFGLFHIFHAPFPNWRYVLLATVAGWFYGSAFRNGGGLMASAFTHAMVDTLWRTLFSKS